jgi:hypothetical protein
MDYNARFYDPLLGRFTSPDSIVPDAGSVVGYNRYAYVNNNPVRYSDPSGHKLCEDGDCREPQKKKNSTIVSDPPGQKIIYLGGFQVLQSYDIPFQTYREAAEEGYNGHSWGGTPDNGILYPPTGKANFQFACVEVGAATSVINDFLIIARPYIDRARTPTSQNVFMQYSIVYDRLTYTDYHKQALLDRIIIYNDFEYSAVNYFVRVDNLFDFPMKSAGPGESIIFNVPNEYDISLGVNIVIYVNNFCYGPCIYSKDSATQQGRTEINVPQIVDSEHYNWNNDWRNYDWIR